MIVARTLQHPHNEPLAQACRNLLAATGRWARTWFCDVEDETVMDAAFSFVQNWRDDAALKRGLMAVFANHVAPDGKAGAAADLASMRAAWELDRQYMRDNDVVDVTRR